MAIGALRATKILHYGLISNCLRSPMQFFDTTPSGRIMNRFSKDIDGIDTVIPRTVDMWVRCIAHVVGSIFVICYSTPLFLSAILPLGVFYYFIQVYQ